MADLRELGFSRKIDRPGLAELLAQKYPAHKWEQVYLLKGRFTQQKRLENAVAALFQVLGLTGF